MVMGRREALTRRRRACGISQEELASSLRVDPRTVGRWEAGTAEPQPWLRPNLARLLSLTLEELDQILIAADGDSGQRGLLVLRTANALLPRGVEPNSAGNIVGPPPISMHGHRSFDVLAMAEHVRTLADRSFVPDIATHDRIDYCAETFEWRRREYCANPPLAILPLLLEECSELQDIAHGHHPAATQRRLSGLTANYATLIADALMKLGEQLSSRSWYSTAMLAADDTGDALLRAQVRAQAAMLPYYYGRVTEALSLTREAQQIACGRSGSPVALAAAGEARALARLGLPQEAEAALRRCQEAFERADEPDDEVAFRFTERRLMLYLSGTLTNLGEIRRASEVQHATLARYKADNGIDPVLISLDQAICLALDGAPVDACQLAQVALSALSSQQRTGVVLARASDLLAAIPEGPSSDRAAADLRESLALPPNP